MPNQDIIQLVVEFFSGVNCTYKVKLKNKPLTKNWDLWLIQPVKGYIEFGPDPVRISEVEWIQINPIERVHLGIRVPDKYVDHTDVIKNYFDQNSIQYKIDEGIIYIIFQDN